jgi:hypothetical protein
VFHLEEIASPDLEAKYNAAAGLVQALSERFYPIEQDYSSYTIYAHEADCTSARALDPDVRLSMEHTLQLLSPMQHQEALEALQRGMGDSQEVWQKWQSLITLLAEMAVSLASLRGTTNQHCTVTYVDMLVSFRLPPTARSRMIRGTEARRRTWTGQWCTVSPPRTLPRRHRLETRTPSRRNSSALRVISPDLET